MNAHACASLPQGVVCAREVFWRVRNVGGLRSSVSLTHFLRPRSIRKRSSGRKVGNISSSTIIMASSASTFEGLRTQSRPFGVLFVCLGNICRSPTAEAVFKFVVEKRGLGSYFNIDSAGTINYHEGEPADARMKAAATKRGMKITSISRPIRPSDFKDFDLILAMDRKNKEDILKAHERWSSKQTLPLNSLKKVKMICDYCKKFKETEVPDPYYGGAAGFEKVLDMLEDACESLLDSVLSQHSKA